MSLLKQYDSFLLNNASQITAVESTLRSITYFLPGRFKDAELAGEAIYSALNILGLYHDGILVRALNAEASSSSSRPVAGTSASPLTLSEHARYTQHFSHKSKAYNVLARTLVVIGYLELLAEMAARRKLAKKRSWDVVAGIEAVKVLLRLSLFYATGGRTTIQPPIPEREVDPALLEEERAKKMGSFANSLDKSPERSRLTEGDAPRGYWKGTRTGFLRPTLASLRPGSQDAKVEELEGPAGLVDRRPPHLRALQVGADNSGSDSDDTLVDSARLHGTSSLSSSRTFGQNGTTIPATTVKQDLPSSPASIEPWTEKQINDYLLSRVLNVNDVRKPDELVRPLQSLLGKSAETLWILRPLIYVLALRKWGRKHTAPFLLSFALEYLARTMRVRSFSEGKSSMLGNPLVMALMGGNPMMGLMTALMGARSGGKEKPISSVEEMEWTRRDRGFWWYLLRGPAWYGWTRPKLSNLVAKTENKTLIGMVGGIIGDYLPLVDDYYFYSAT